MSYEVHQLFKTPSLTHFIEVGFLIGCGVAFLGALLRLLAVCLFRPELLIVGRFITSMCEAVTYQSCILYLQECSPTNLRGMMTFLSEISFSSMCLVGMFLGTRQLLGDNLVAFMGFAVPFCAFFFIALCFLPETPKYLLIVRSNTLEAERSIRFYHGIDCDVDTVIKEIIMEAEGEVESATASWNSIKEIFIEPHLRRAVLLSISALQNTVPLWSMLLSSTYFLEEIGLDHSLASWCSTAMTLGYTIGTVAGSTWIERFGRRTILLSFTIVDNVLLVLYVMCAELSPFVDSFKYGCLVLLVIYAFVYGSGVGPISWFISSELVPQKYRSLTQSICYALNTVIVVILTFSILPLYIIIKSYAFLILFTIPSTVSIVILYCYLPETKGREIHEIVDELRGKTKSG